MGKDRGRGRRSGYLDSNRDMRRPSGECRRESWAITVAIRQLCPKARARRSNPDERELRGRDSNPDNQLQRLASCRLDDPALGLVRIADRTGFRRSIWEHVFLPDRPRKYDWDAVRAYYEAGHSMRECQACLSFVTGAWHKAMRRGDVVTGAPSKPEARESRGRRLAAYAGSIRSSNRPRAWCHKVGDLVSYASARCPRTRGFCPSL